MLVQKSQTLSKVRVNFQGEEDNRAAALTEFIAFLDQENKEGFLDFNGFKEAVFAVVDPSESMIEIGDRYKCLITSCFHSFLYRNRGKTFENIDNVTKILNKALGYAAKFDLNPDVIMAEVLADVDSKKTLTSLTDKEDLGERVVGQGIDGLAIDVLSSLSQARKIAANSLKSTTSPKGSSSLFNFLRGNGASGGASGK